MTLSVPKKARPQWVGGGTEPFTIGTELMGERYDLQSQRRGRRVGIFCFGVPERNPVDCNPVSAAISKAAGQWAHFLWLSAPVCRACVCLQGLLAHSYLQLVRENAHSFLALLRVAMPRAVLLDICARTLSFSRNLHTLYDHCALLSWWRFTYGSLPWRPRTLLMLRARTVGLRDTRC